jgi:hypothetical protein
MFIAEIAERVECGEDSRRSTLRLWLQLIFKDHERAAKLKASLRGGMGRLDDVRE